MIESADDRFKELPRLVKARIRVDVFSHWIWIGEISRGGPNKEYGRITTAQARRTRPGHRQLYLQAHRHVYELLVGPIPQGFVIDHLCGETLCVRPSHLEPVTINENSRRGTRTPPRNLDVPLSIFEWHQPGLWDYQ